MFESIFENRDKKLASLIELGDSLGRSIRQNISLFSVDDHENEVAFVTESGHVISGQYVIGDNVSLKNVEIRTSELFESQETFDDLVDSKVSLFLGSIHEDRHSDAEANFDGLLGAYQSRLKFSNIKQRLEEKSSKFGPTLSIVDTREFQHLLEVVPQLVEFLQESKEKIESVSEVTNAVKLTTTVGQAFDIPRLTLETLNESDYDLKPVITESVYDVICRQELVTQELLENRANFSTIWAHSEKVRALAESIHEDNKTVEPLLAEALAEVPYLALVSKYDLKETFNNALGIHESLQLQEKDVAAHASRVFEMKKDIKKALSALLNEKYGVNVAAIKEGVSFKGLANTQVVILETLSRLAPRGSVLKKVLAENAQMLKSKSGVEVLDVNDLLEQVFVEAEYVLGESAALSKYLDFGAVADDLGGVAEILRMIRGVATQAIASVEGPGAAQEDPLAGGDALGGGLEPQLDPAQQQLDPQLDPNAQQPGMGGPAELDPTENPAGPGGSGLEPGTEDDDSGPAMEAPDAAAQALGPEGVEAGMVDPGEEMPGQEVPGMEEDPLEMGHEQVMATMTALEKLLADLKMEAGLGDDLGMEDEEMGPMGQDELDTEGGDFGDEEEFGDEMGGEEEGEFGGEEEEFEGGGEGEEEFEDDDDDDEEEFE